MDAWTKMVGAVLRDIRKKKRLSQEVVSGLLGINRNQYSKMERGEIVPTVPMLFCIAEVFHVSAQTLFDAIDAAEMELQNDASGEDCADTLYLEPELPQTTRESFSISEDERCGA